MIAQVVCYLKFSALGGKTQLLNRKSMLVFQTVTDGATDILKIADLYINMHINPCNNLVPALWLYKV